MVGLFSSANKESGIGVDFLQQGVAVAQLQAEGSNTGQSLALEIGI
jgi:hypothetical protein